MPIRAENKERYPENWKEISEAVRDEAGNRCEWCNAPNGVTICRGDGNYMLPSGHIYDDRKGMFLGVGRGSEYDGKLTRVVLTVAHMDHQPENCSRENLKALCQLCHNRYDAPMRAQGRKDRAREARAASDLFGD